MDGPWRGQQGHQALAAAPLPCSPVREARLNSALPNKPFPKLHLGALSCARRGLDLVFKGESHCSCVFSLVRPLTAMRGFLDQGSLPEPWPYRRAPHRVHVAHAQHSCPGGRLVWLAGWEEGARSDSGLLVQTLYERPWRDRPAPLLRDPGVPQVKQLGGNFLWEVAGLALMHRTQVATLQPWGASQVPPKAKHVSAWKGSSVASQPLGKSPSLPVLKRQDWRAHREAPSARPVGAGMPTASCELMALACVTAAQLKGRPPQCMQGQQPGTE